MAGIDEKTCRVWKTQQVMTDKGRPQGATARVRPYIFNG